jgi:DnaK suppressor protein
MTEDVVTRRALALRLVELEERAARIKADLSEPLSADFEEQAVEAEDEESLQAQEMHVMHKVAAVRAAIARVDEGRYGICLTCGGKIAAARLAVMPEATQCIECAKQPKAD